jgi:hypothetical protein
MAQRRSSPQTDDAPDLFGQRPARRRTGLFLGRYLADEAEKMFYRGPRQDNAHAVMQRWADLERDGALRQKETALDADFLREVFGEALGYASSTQSPDDYQLERNFTVPGVGTADAALGNFQTGRPLSPLVVVELKGAATDLDRHRFGGRTPVQQCWDYLNALPGCPWGIVSNFRTIRLYHRDKTQLAYEEFRLQELRDLKRLRQFYCVFERGGLVRPELGQPLRALRLLELTESRQREVGDELYAQYSENRLRLIEHLHARLGRDLDDAIHVAQKILDRIIFVAFCEDRGLLPADTIDRAYKTLPPFSKVTNPRWRNFLDLFHAMDQGHPALLNIATGYDGGLFAHDAEVDGLQLDDEWTHFFHNVGKYDFRDEVSVEVLGHLFERSVAELEQLRAGGLFDLDAERERSAAAGPRMRKSAERKRYGIFYTPPEFTRAIVERTLGETVAERLDAVRRAHGLEPADLESREPSPRLAAFGRDAFEALRGVTVCDPACGSGAFLIRAYDLLEEAYSKIVEQLAVHDPEGAENLAAAVPDAILADNLYGVDLSPEAVEITQLSLWIRSARPNETLADLSRNIVCGNSLVADPGVHPRAMDWASAFPRVFGPKDQGGFACVVGNPPWERLKLQEREFFARAAPDIAGAVSAATRRRKIEKLVEGRPELHERYRAAQQLAETTLAHVRQCGHFPLTARGDINTYMLFAELARRIVAPDGRIGLLLPSGIATDNTTRAFFAELVESGSLGALYDFENRKGFFPDVHRAFKFCILLFGGRDRRFPSADFVFFAHRMEDLDERRRHIALSKRDLKLLNPNTRTCPVFRTRRDAELTKGIYRRVPILIDQSRKAGGNPWGVKYVRMFDQTNDAERFRTAEELAAEGFRLDGNRWRKGKRVFLPLYEAKMVQAYDHRAAGVVVVGENWVRQGQTEPTTLVMHQNPEFVVQPRWWVDEADVDAALGGSVRPAYLCYKDVTSPTNRRTMIAAMIPRAAVVNSAPLVLTGEEIGPRRALCLLANLNSLALDYVARQKVGGIHLNYFIVNQLPLFGPERYEERCPWNKRQKLEKWISDRVLRLSCTADDMRPLGTAAGFDPPVHRWNPAERVELLAELDAAFFLLYGLGREDVEYVLGTFAGDGGGAETGRLFPADEGILGAYDRLAQAVADA